MPRPLASAVLIAVSLLTPFLPPRAGAELLLNEILYDPAGPDEGMEFVELWNPDTAAVSLAGILLEAGDGARPGVWTSVYAGSALDLVPPRHVFLIRGSALLGALQNGPDAVRLRRGEVVLDLLGYGALTAPELFEGAPAEDAPSGMSLARVEDGRDTERNASDWAVEPDPSPGFRNHPDLRLKIARGRASMEAEVPWPGEIAVLHLLVRNRGRLEVPGARWRVEADWSRGGGGGTWSPFPARGGGAGATPAGSGAGVLRRGAPPRLSVPLGPGLAGVFGAAHIGGRRGARRLAWARGGAPGFIRRGFPGPGRVDPGGTRPRAHRFANHGVDRGRAHPPHETARPRGSPRLLGTRRRDHGGRERAQRPRALGTRRHAQPPRRARSPAGRRRAREARPRQRAREDRRGPRDPDRKSGGFLGPPGLRVRGNDHRAPARDFGLQKEAARRGGGPRERRTEFQERVRAIGAGSASSNRGSPSTRACRSRRRSATGGPGRPCRSNARRALPA